MVKGRKVSLGLDLMNSYEQHKPSAGASLNVAQRATSRLVSDKTLQVTELLDATVPDCRFRLVF